MESEVLGVLYVMGIFTAFVVFALFVSRDI